MAGIRAHAITAPNEDLPTLQSWASCLGSALESFEGPNEYDISHGSDSNWVSTLQTYQTSLYSWKGSLGNRPIIGPALTSGSAWSAVGDLSSSLDYGNMHDYFAHFNPGTPGWGGSDSCGRYGAMTWNMCLARRVAGSKPIISTENGYDEGISGAIKARYLVRDYLEHWNAGVPRMYLYNMVDDGGQSYGILDSGLNPRPAYTMLQNVIAHFRDQGGAFSPAPLSLTINGNAHHLLMGRRDGSYQLALWVEAQEWEPSVPVSLQFGRTPSSVTATTYNDAGNPVTQTLDPANATPSVDGHVTVVDIK
jgi:hypothetical protein